MDSRNSKMELLTTDLLLKIADDIDRQCQLMSQGGHCARPQEYSTSVISGALRRVVKAHLQSKSKE